LVVGTGRDGRYEVTAAVTLDYVAGADNFEVGVSLNGASPVAGRYNGGIVDVTYTTACITISCVVDLVATDTLEVAVQNLDGTNNVIITHGQLTARKIS
jgi:hypothetical protein